MRVPGVVSEVFVEAHLGQHILHAPLLEISCCVNRSLAEELGLAARTKTVPRDAVLAELESHGLTAEPTQLPALNVEERPCEVTLALSGRCNLRCSYCYAHGGDTTERMPIGIARAALSRIARHAAGASQPSMTVHLHGGGEPTSDWDFMRRVIDEAETIALKAGLGLRLTAGLNGMLSEYRANQAARLFDEVTVSLDGGEELHNRQRPKRDGGGSWSAVARTLAVFDERAVAYGVRMTVTAESVDELPDSVRAVCETSRARPIQVEPASPIGRGRRTEVVQAEDFVASFRRARVIAEDHGRELRTSGARFPQVSQVFCRAVTGSLCVKPSGRIVACYEAPDEDGPFDVGRVNAESNELFFDEERRRSMLRYSVFEQQQCVDCVARYHCAGDCPMKRNHRGSTERCRANRVLTLDQILVGLESKPQQSVET